jgi:predicted DNA-binding transcriptional regulator AlpA
LTTTLATGANSTEPTYISVPALARRLSVAKDTLYKACRAGQIPGAFQISSRWLVNLDAFEAAQQEAARAVALRQVEAH